jgi:hypothetical protein
VTSSAAIVTVPTAAFIFATQQATASISPNITTVPTSVAAAFDGILVEGSSTSIVKLTLSTISMGIITCSKVGKANATNTSDVEDLSSLGSVPSVKGKLGHSDSATGIKSDSITHLKKKTIPMVLVN